MVNVVQFMHPGDEVDPSKLVRYKGWNVTERHARRLLRHRGEYVNSQKQLVSADITFWNEYEAPTNCTPILGGIRGWEFAKNVHEIITPSQAPALVVQRGSDGCCVNTDPCVFGKTFKYSNCQQVPNGDLWNIPIGSLILFGSYRRSLFALDTVFVVGESGIAYRVPTKRRPLPFKTSKEYRFVTLDNLTVRKDKRCACPIDRFMFYRGKTPLLRNGKIDFESIFSYTPSKVYGSPDFNKRCMLDLNCLNTFMQNNNIVSRKLFSPGLTQGHSSIIVNGTNQEVRLVWKEVRRIVQKVNKFELGVHFPW